MRTIGLVAACMTALLTTSTMAQEYPDRPVEVVVGASPGGSLDTMARLVARELTDHFGQPFVVENRPGANNSVAAQYVSNAAPDGYVLNLIGLSHSTPDQSLNLGYDPVTSFAPVALLAENPSVLVVTADSEFTTFDELVQFARANPGELNFATAGVGSPPWLATTLMNDHLGLEMFDIRYDGSSASLVALLGAEVQLMFGSIGLVAGQIETGELVPLAISTAERSPLLPDVPTMAEVTNIEDFHVANWTGLLAPADTPDDVVAALFDGVVKMNEDAEVIEFLSNSGFTPVVAGPEEFEAFLASQVQSWGRLIAEFGRE